MSVASRNERTHAQADSGSFSEKDPERGLSPVSAPSEVNADLPDSDSKFPPVNGTQKLDPHGLPLIPQPTDQPDDPLNWPQWLKIAILIQASIAALLGPCAHAIVNPAYVPIMKAFHLPSVTVASYQTVTALAAAGVAPLLWVPLANVWGRRPVYIGSLIIGCFAGVGAGKATTYGSLIGARLVHGVGTSAAMSLGASTVADLFFLHERGKMMGIFTVAVTQGAHIAALCGGYIAQYSSYHWCYYAVAIADGILVVIMLFCLPETLYVRPTPDNPNPAPVPAQSIRARMKLWGFRPANRRLRIVDIVRPFQMAFYPTILITCLYYSVQFSYSSIEPAVTVASLFTQLYHFEPGRIGLCLGLSTLIGASLGELLSGPIIDRTMMAARKKAGGKPLPEARLQAIWTGAILVPVGLLVFGLCLKHKTTYIGPCIGMALANLGAQVIASVCYTYCSDCYKPQTGEISSLFNFVRQTFGFTLGFYSLPYGQRVGFDLAMVTYVFIGLGLFVPVLVIMFRGQQIRAKFGTPTFNKGF